MMLILFWLAFNISSRVLSNKDGVSISQLDMIDDEPF